MMAACSNEPERRSGGCSTGTRPVSARGNRPGPRTGMKRSSDSGIVYRPETTTAFPLCAEDRNLHSVNGRIFIWRTSPVRPFRAQKTHEVNQRGLKHLRAVFEEKKLAEITADDIETYLRQRLKQRVTVKTKGGVIQKGVLKATTVHQEFRVIRRMLNVAVRKKLLFANPCSGVEFPARVDTLFRPHYMSWSEQQKIEFAAPEYLRNVIRIITETGLRIYKELIPMQEGATRSGEPDGVDFGFEDAKRCGRGAALGHRYGGVSRARSRSQDRELTCSRMLSSPGHQKSFKKVWRLTLRRGGHSVLPDLRSPFDVRDSAECRWCGRRVCDSDAAANRCQGVQEVLADEASDEAGGTHETEPPRQRGRHGFGTGAPN